MVAGEALWEEEAGQFPPALVKVLQEMIASPRLRQKVSGEDVLGPHCPRLQASPTSDTGPNISEDMFGTFC